MSHRLNITRIKAVYNALEEMASEVVFVGGATVSLYTDRPGGETRPTEDVDILVEVARYSGYAAVEERLRAKGFINDVESRVICRYKVNGIIVDVMPASEDILGFSNRWYKQAFENAMQVTVDTDYKVNIFSAPYFLASKLEAFKHRGKNDGRTSSDFEDIIFVLNNRSKIWDELAATTDELREYFLGKLRSLLSNPYFEEWIGANLDYTEQGRVNYILKNIRELVEIEAG
jgi:predicted nucleotidyltransferase